MASVDDKQAKGAQNQALFREVNERIERLAGDGAPDSETIHFVCECANRDCVETIPLSIDKYEDIRQMPTHFPVLLGHHDPEIERIIEETERYVIVEKVDAAGKIAVRLDPRRRALPDGSAA